MRPRAPSAPRVRSHRVSTHLHDGDGENPYHEEFAYGSDLVLVSTAVLSDHEATMRQIMERGRAP
ncbi:hypothetical protein ACH4FV_24915 [Streptomyces anulatus]|uniref:hypothetical protein n=1 Tax=Streptomyces anulatus TaxID=1892 RepID=UPI002E112EC0